jgi:hypothetical protein
VGPVTSAAPPKIEAGFQAIIGERFHCLLERLERKRLTYPTPGGAPTIGKNRIALAMRRHFLCT